MHVPDHYFPSLFSFVYKVEMTKNQGLFLLSMIFEIITGSLNESLQYGDNIKDIAIPKRPLNHSGINSLLSVESSGMDW
jgi:hypothetical protein